MQRWSHVSKGGPVPSPDLSSGLFISFQIPGSGGRTLSACSKASMIGGDSSAKCQEGHCSAVGDPHQKTSARKYSRLWQLIPVPLPQHYKAPLVLVLLQPGKKGWLGTRGTHSFLLPLALLCPGSTWGFLQHILWHWHCSGHGHNIHLSHSCYNKKSHVFLSAPFRPRGLFNKEMLLGFLCW